MSVNKVTLLGNTGKAPDFKEFDNGGCVATITLATTKRGFTTKDDAQGVKRYITEIVATDMEMLTPKTTGAGTQAPPTAPPAPAPEPSDDLPF
jgi:single-strand DNA-binding protein